MHRNVLFTLADWFVGRQTGQYEHSIIRIKWNILPRRVAEFNISTDRNIHVSRQYVGPTTTQLLFPAPRVGGIKRRCASYVCLSDAYIGSKSRIERPRKTKIGTEVAHVTRTPLSWSKGQGHRGGGREGSEILENIFNNLSFGSDQHKYGTSVGVAVDMRHRQ